MAVNIEFLRDITHNLAAERTVPPESWLQGPLLPSQRRFLELPTKYRAFIGGIGSGKSHVGCLLALSRMQPGQNGLVVAATYRSLGAVCEALILEHLNDKDCSYTFRKAEETLTYAGATTFFRSAERPDLLRGLSCNWAWLDEASQMSEDLWRIVLGRLRQGDPAAWITTTPKSFNWVFDKFVEDTTGEYSYTQAITAENSFLPKEYVASLERNYSGAFHDQELLGQFTAPSGLVYPGFRREVHVIEPFPIPDSWTRIAAIDFGYQHPFAAVWIAFDEDKRAYVYREYRQAQRLLRDHAEVLKSEKVAYIVADHDAQDRQELHALRVPTIPAKKEVVAGIQAVQSRLEVQGDGRPRLYVFKNCPLVQREFGTYSWFESNSVVSANEQVRKVEDDLMDALRYGLYFEDSRHGIQIWDFNFGL